MVQFLGVPQNLTAGLSRKGQALRFRPFRLLWWAIKVTNFATALLARFGFVWDLKPLPLQVYTHSSLAPVANAH
jgi:hypothetical protein